MRIDFLFTVLAYWHLLLVVPYVLFVATRAALGRSNREDDEFAIVSLFVSMVPFSGTVLVLVGSVVLTRLYFGKE